MKLQSHLIRILILTLLLLGVVIPTQAQAPVAQPCDVSGYTSGVIADITAADAAIRSANRSDIPTTINAYSQLAALRQKYEDMVFNVPPCASVLHSLITQWFAAGADKVAYILAMGADPTNASLYQERISQTDARLNDLAIAANNEFQRIQPVAAEPEPAPPEPTPSPAGDFYRVYFTDRVNSDEDADHHGSFMEQSLIFMINNAQSTIDAALFELDAPDTTAALVAAARRGVRIRIVADDEHNLDDPGSTIEELIAVGVQVRTDNRSALMHSKFFIFDGVTVWTGATNITRNGIYNNDNNAILIQSPPLALNFQAEFEEMFTDSGFSRTQNPRRTPNPVITIGNTTIETYFSPEDGRLIESRLVQLMNGAQRSIRVMAFSFTLSSVGDAMINRIGQGVVVQGVFETTGSNQGQMPRLFCAGANVRQDGNPSIMHHKVFIIDDRYVVTGSFNFSASARDNNTENLLVIDDPNIAALYVREFDRRFAEGRTPSVNCPA